MRLKISLYYHLIIQALLNTCITLIDLSPKKRIPFNYKELPKHLLNQIEFYYK